MPRLAHNRRLMYAFAAVRNLGNSVTAIFGIIFIFQQASLAGVVVANLAWHVGAAIMVCFAVPASRRILVRALSVAGLGLTALGYGFLSAWESSPGLPPLAVISLLIGFGVELTFWVQDVLLKSCMESGGAGRSSAAFATTLALSSAAAMAVVGTWAEGGGLGAALALAAGAYALSVVPLLWYHEGHLAHHLPAADSLKAEFRRVRGEYAFRSDALRFTLTGLHVEAYSTAILPSSSSPTRAPRPWWAT